MTNLYGAFPTSKVYSKYNILSLLSNYNFLFGFHEESLIPQSLVSNFIEQCALRCEGEKDRYGFESVADPGGGPPRPRPPHRAKVSFFRGKIISYDRASSANLVFGIKRNG